MGQEYAKIRADGIRGMIETVANHIEKIPEFVAYAYAAEDWKHLGYPSWEAYVTGEFGTSLIKLDVAVRKVWEHRLADAGMSTREIAPVVNVSAMTVSRDLHPKPAVTNVTAGEDEPPWRYYECPGCHKNLRVPASAERIRCGGCKTVFNTADTQRLLPGQRTETRTPKPRKPVWEQEQDYAADTMRKLEKLHDLMTEDPIGDPLFMATLCSIRSYLDEIVEMASKVAAEDTGNREKLRAELEQVTGVKPFKFDDEIIAESKKR